MNKDLKEMHRKIMLGKNNPRWNNGVSEYPNHSLLKKRRIEVLKKSKGNCEICEEHASIVHHIDGNKSNHLINNLIPLCNQCHWALHKKEYGDRGRTSKYMRMYGMTLTQIANKLNSSPATIYYWLKDPNKKTYVENKIQEFKTEMENDAGSSKVSGSRV